MIAWTGAGVGAQVHHVWLLRAADGRGCEFLTAEAQRRTVPRLVGPLRPGLLRMHQQWVDTLAKTTVLRSPTF